MSYETRNTLSADWSESVGLDPKKNNNTVRAFVVGEDFAGMRAQALGLAERAGWAGTFHPVALNSAARLAMSYAPAWARQVLFQKWGKTALLPYLQSFKQADPAVIISVGGKGGVVGAALRVQHCPVVQVQHPRQDISRFDLVIACQHDNLRGKNVLVGRTAVHGLTPARLEAARRVWAPRWHALPRPLIGVLLGGSNGRYRFTPKEAHRLGQILLNTCRTEGGSLMVTSSRRTPPAVCAILSHYICQAGGMFWHGDGENPYTGLIACADRLLVTMDSVSMVSEAVAGTAPVVVFPFSVGCSRRITDFLHVLQQARRIRVLDATETTLPPPWHVHPLDDTPTLIAEMHQRLGF
ncbi:MAG: mitochondrial fission ELM1 family protein [Acetobacter sp.]|nr:mitochondrial fission ELM1 family protein [Acetobacter sp.]